MGITGSLLKYTFPGPLMIYWIRYLSKILETVFSKLEGDFHVH